MANIGIRNGSYDKINNLTTDGDIGFARLGDDATIVWKDGSKLRKILPPPGDANSLDKPLVSTGSTTSPQYKTLPISGGGTGSTSSLEAIKNLGINTVAYATCSTAAATAIKEVSIQGGNWIMAPGAMIAIKFTNTNTANNPKLKINSKEIFIHYEGSSITTSNLEYAGYENRVLNYVYDGTYLIFMGWGYDKDTTYSNESLGQGYGTCSTAAATVAKAASLSSYNLVTGGIVSVKFTYDVPANATLNINSTGAKHIYYRGNKITDKIIKAGDVATFIYSTYYYLISIDRWQNDITSLQTQFTNIEADITDINTSLRDKVSKSSTSVQTIAGGLLIGGSLAASGTGKGRVVVTGASNPLFGLHAIDSNGNLLTPYYLQVASDTLLLGPTSAKATSFDKEGNVSMPFNLTVKGNVALEKPLPISSGGTGSTSSLEAIKNLNIKTVAYATCETAAGTAEKVIKTADSQWILSVGAMVAVKFSNTNTATNPKFKINNGSSTYPVKYGTANLSTSSLSYAGYKGRVLNYIYDGSSFVFIGQSYVPTYSNASLGQGYGSCSTEASVLTKVATVSSYSLSKGGIVSIEFANKVPANSTLNISSKGEKPIYYDGKPIVDNIIQAGDIATFIYTGTYYYLITIDRWQKDIETLQSTTRAIESSITTLGQNRTQVKIITWDDADLGEG